MTASQPDSLLARLPAQLTRRASLRNLSPSLSSSTLRGFFAAALAVMAGLKVQPSGTYPTAAAAPCCCHACASPAALRPQLNLPWLLLKACSCMRPRKPPADGGDLAAAAAAAAAVGDCRTPGLLGVAGASSRDASISCCRSASMRLLPRDSCMGREGGGNQAQSARQHACV